MGLAERALWECAYPRPVFNLVSESLVKDLGGFTCGSKIKASFIAGVGHRCQPRSAAGATAVVAPCRLRLVRVTSALRLCPANLHPVRRQPEPAQSGTHSYDGHQTCICIAQFQFCYLQMSRKSFITLQTIKT